jgi:hypothetical protein
MGWPTTPTQLWRWPNHPLGPQGVVRPPPMAKPPPGVLGMAPTTPNWSLEMVEATPRVELGGWPLHIGWFGHSIFFFNNYLYFLIFIF